VEIQHMIDEQAIAKSTSVKTGFWKRQFAPTVTGPQVIFDVIFGVVGPILCFVIDPVVFRGWLFGPLFPEYQTFAYLFSGLQITLLCFWLVTGPVWQFWNRLMGGMLLCGALFCVVVGLVLAPFSLVGLMIYGIGVFGLTPFLTALVYLRNSSRALRSEARGAGNFVGVIIPASGILLVAGLPLMLSIQIHWAVTRAVTEIVEGDPQHAMFAAQRLVPLRFLASAELDQIVTAYSASSDEKRKELLKSCYREITGDSIENRAHSLDD
jgi:hypothetical protein